MMAGEWFVHKTTYLHILQIRLSQEIRVRMQYVYEVRIAADSINRPVIIAGWSTDNTALSLFCFLSCMINYGARFIIVNTCHKDVAMDMSTHNGNLGITLQCTWQLL